MNSNSEAKLTIYFDGVCNLCNGFINWLIDKDKMNSFLYASLQGETAKKSLSETVIQELSTVLVVEKSTGKAYRESQAFLLILKFLPTPYPFLAKILWLLPSAFLDTCYRMIAKNRYSLFGKKETCRLPTSEEKHLFLP